MAVLTRGFPLLLPLQIRITTPNGDEGLFDFAVVSTGLLTDARLRPELSAAAEHIATWADKLPSLPEGMARNALIDVHPYLGPSFEFQEKVGRCLRALQAWRTVLVGGFAVGRNVTCLVCAEQCADGVLLCGVERGCDGH